MKKVIVLLVFITSVNLASAQDGSSNTSDNKPFSLGFNASPNIGWLSAQDSEPNDQIDVSSSGGRLGFAYGLMFEYAFTTNYVLAASVNHLFSGGKYNVVNNTSPTALNMPNNPSTPLHVAVDYSPVKLQYVQIPITIRLKTNEIGYIRYFGDLGFAGAFSLNSKTNNSVTQYVYNESSNDVALETKEFENRVFKDKFLGTYFLVGAGGQYSLGGNTFIHAGLTVNLGLSSVLSKKEVEDYSDLSANARLNNTFIAINLGIIL